MKIYCNEHEWKDVCASIAFSIQKPFDHCLKEGCLCDEEGLPCYKVVEECLKRIWEVHINE